MGKTFGLRQMEWNWNILGKLDLLEKQLKVRQTSGIIPFVKVVDSLTLAISQGSLRRGSAACYLNVHHPEVKGLELESLGILIEKVLIFITV